MTPLTLKRWTVRQMQAEGACYSVEQIRELWGMRESLSLLEILDLQIPVVDRLWVCHRPGAVPDDLYACWREIVLTRAIEKYARHCGVTAVEHWMVDDWPPP